LHVLGPALTSYLRPAAARRAVPGLHRILLKDFRDVRGDALFGKRTFLVRHGRVWTCRFSAVAWTGGTALPLLAIRGSAALICSYATGTVATVLLLRALSHDRSPRRDETIISALALVGRGLLVSCSLRSQ